MVDISVLFLAEALVLLLYRVSFAKKRRELIFLFASLVLGALLAVYEGTSLVTLLLGIVIFNNVASTYHTKQNYVFFFLGAIYVVQLHMFVQLTARAMLLGFLSAAYFFTKHTERVSMELERKRDVIQVFFGLVFLYVVSVLPWFYVSELLIAGVMLFSLVGNFGISNKKSWVSKMLHSFERSGAVLGQGAMWLAVGTLVAVSFLEGSQIVAVLVPIFLGDAVATLVGTTFKAPLPYNKNKSAFGTLAYFASAAIASFPFVGYLGVGTALVGALVESLPKHLDDNFDTAIALTLLVKLVGFAGF